MNKTIHLLVLLLFSAFLCSGQTVRKELNGGWKFRQLRIGEWLPATVPGTVHTDLLANGKIEDPFFRDNEKKVQWIDKVNWEYTTTFQVGDDILSSPHRQLIFYGLDTWCDIFLNGKHIGSSDNMFRTWKIDVSGQLKKGDNILNLRFYSPIHKGVESLEAYGLALPASNDYSEYGGMGAVRVSVYGRKAPYHFGWDWGPRLVTSGIWRPVVLEAWESVKMESVFIRQPSVNRTIAELEAELHLLSGSDHDLQIEILHSGKKLTSRTVSISKGNNEIRLPFTIKNPHLWWSNGLGSPHLYDFTVLIKKGDVVLAQENVTTGLRSLKLVRKKDSRGESFGFELNGVPVFAKGSNSIPNDLFLPRITRKDYEKVVTDVAAANMNMIRIWGGGIYEDDYFYELCDRHGIMVWQDFMFACAMYPGDSVFLENVRQEAIDNVIRLRNHPCIALWCGNNEIDLAWRHDSKGGWGWKQAYSKTKQEQIFKAYTDLFHDLLPEVVSRYTDGDDYWPSSPMSGPTVNQHNVYTGTSGDNHYWGVWHEKHKIEAFEDNIGRFMSEYGFQSFPGFETVKKYALPADFDIESEVMSAHQRSGIGNLRIKEYMEWYYPVPEDFEQFLYMSQVLQAHAMRTALEAHRRAMPYCMGSLMWQLNDCWPVASWSTTDYYHNWKAAHYAIREACKPVILAAQSDTAHLQLWVVNDKLTSLRGTWLAELFDFNGQLVNRTEGKWNCSGNSSDSVAGIDKKIFLKGYPANEVVALLTLKAGKTVVDEQTVWFALPKELKLTTPVITTTIKEENGEKYLTVTTDQPACDVMFYTREQGVTFSDNYLTLLPGRTYTIELQTDLPSGQIHVFTRSVH